MTSKILVPVDGSPLSRQAFEQALSDADAVVALHVVDPSEPGYSTPMDVDMSTEPLLGSEEWYERAAEVAEELFDELREQAADADTAIETETVRGDPVRTIVEYASSHDVDAIYMGSHGRTGDTSILLGRVAELVAARSPVTVTIVR